MYAPVLARCTSFFTIVSIFLIVSFASANSLSASFVSFLCAEYIAALLAFSTSLLFAMSCSRSLSYSSMCFLIS